MTITELSIKRPSLVIVVFAALAVLGIFSYYQLQYELLPKITPPIVTIATQYPGASPAEVETGVTKPIEDAVSGMDKVSTIRSSSMENLSFITIELQQSANVDNSLQDAIRKVGEVTATLPTGVKSPTISKIALDEVPVLRVGLSSNMDRKNFTQFIDDQIKPQLSKVAGVGQVNVIGGEKREIKINLDMDKVRSYGLSIQNITTSIKNGNLDFPTGKIESTDGQYVVRVAGKYTSVDELRKLSIGKSKTGGQILLGDIAEVQDGIQDITNVTRINMQPTISMNIQKQTDANAVEVSKLLRAKMKNLETKYAKMNLHFDVAQDISTFTTDAADAVKEDLLLAVVLVALVMLLFLHSLRNSVIVMIAIPASLISTFIMMYAFGFTLNLMTLLGLSLVVGILVDDSIVVLENIYHHLEQGEEKRVAALRGRNEIGFAALAITMVDVSVFLPLGLVSGIIGNIMREFSMVVVTSTLLSLFVSFTVTPTLASRFAKLERLKDTNPLGKFAIWFERKFREYTDKYIVLLEWSLHHRGRVFGAAVVLFFLSLALAPLGFIGAEFMTQADRGEFAVTLELAPGVTIDQTNMVSFQVEQLIGKIPEVKRTFANVGVSSEGLLGFSSNNNSEINVTLVDKKDRKRSTDEVGEEIKRMVQGIPGVKVRVNPIGIFGTANQTPIQLVITGVKYEDVTKAAKMIQNEVKKIPGTADVRLSSEDGKPETRINIDRDKLNYYGLSIADVGGTLRTALTGDDDSKFRDGADEYVLRVQLDKFDRSSTEDLQHIVFMNKKNEQIELQQFATVVRTVGPTKLQREDRNAAVTLYSQVIGRPTGSVSADINKTIKDMQLPQGVSLVWSGDVKNQNESNSSLGLALFAAVLFTYMVMVALYNSFVYPFVVLFSIPLAMIGAMFALALAMKSLNIFTILGIIMLVGLVAKNAILIVDRTNQKREEGESVHDALLDAGRMRIRPILMTTLTMIFGMLPIALSRASGAEWKSGLAWALIGGLTSSLLLTLLVVPIVYTKVEEIRTSFPRFVRRLFGRKAAEPATAE
jgi:HAE1 family hydrophobic/amphiphilic exporter-1